MLVNGKIAVEMAFPPRNWEIEKGFGNVLRMPIKKYQDADCEPNSFGKPFLGEETQPQFAATDSIGF